MNIKELRKDMMLSKKTNPDRSKVLQAILAHVEIVVKSKNRKNNREITEKDITNAAKTELGMATESKAQGAYVNPATFEVCDELVPKTLGEDETRAIVQGIVDGLPEGARNMKSMGQVMKLLQEKCGSSLDGKLAASIVRKMLNN